MKRFKYIADLIRFAFRENSLLSAAVVLSLFSVVIELLAMSTLLPLFGLVSQGPSSKPGAIAKALNSIGIAANARSYIWVFIVLFALRILTQLMGQSLSMYLSKRVMAQLGSRAFQQIVHRVAVREITEKSIGFFIGLAGDEAFRASTLVFSLIQFVSTAALALLYYLAIVVYSPATGALVFAFLLSSAIPFLLAMRTTHRLGGRQTEESRRAHSIFLDSLNNLKAVRAFSAEQYVVGLYRTVIFKYAKTLFLNDVIGVLVKLVPVFLLLGLCSIWLMLSTQAIESIGLAFVVTMIIYLMRFFPVVGQCVILSMKIASDAKSGKDVTAMVSSKFEEPHLAGRGVGSISTIRFEDVGFSYDPAGIRDVLRGVDLRFEVGRSYALTGKSGAGKTTLVDILLGFFYPGSGRVLLNDSSITEVSEADIRKRIILVGQEPAIFDDTVMNNICMGMPASVSDVEAACRMACVHDVIESMAEGYQTRLQYQGKNLSGGQRQRIAIARALLRSPDVLILDESTSALDKPTQMRVVESILEAYRHRIVIFITHDPQLFERADEVINLEAANLAASPRLDGEDTAMNRA